MWLCKIAEARHAFVPISSTVANIAEDEWHTGDTLSNDLRQATIVCTYTPPPSIEHII